MFRLKRNLCRKKIKLSLVLSEKKSKKLFNSLKTLAKIRAKLKHQQSEAEEMQEIEKNNNEKEIC